MNEKSTDLVVRDQELDKFARLGQWLAASETGGDNPTVKGATAALRLYYAAELGLPPLAAAELSVIKGRLFVQAKLLRALAVRHGYRVTRTADSNDKTCTAVLTEIATGKELGRTTFTIQDAQKAGLVRDRSAWATHPGRMLWARASKFVLDDYAPEVTLGLGTEDEAAESEGRAVTNPPVDGPDAAEEPEEAEFEPLPPSKEQLDEFYTPTPSSAEQLDDIDRAFTGKNITDRDTRLAFAAQAVGREIKSSRELSKAEANDLLKQIANYDPENAETFPFAQAK